MTAVSIEMEMRRAISSGPATQSLKFSGFTAVYEEGKDEERRRRAPPCRRSEGGGAAGPRGPGARASTSPSPPPATPRPRLIRAMEEKGIGRPSTYAPTVSTILDREYVVKEGKCLHTTPLGEVVTGLMKERFQRHRRREIHRPHGGEAGRCGGGQG